MKSNLKPFLIGGKLYILPFNNENKNSYDGIITLIIIFVVLFVIYLI